MLVHPDWQKKRVIKLVVDKAISVAKKKLNLFMDTPMKMLMKYTN